MDKADAHKTLIALASELAGCAPLRGLDLVLENSGHRARTVGKRAVGVGLGRAEERLKLISMRMREAADVLAGTGP